jgi:hypothetical protein
MGESTRRPMAGEADLADLSVIRATDSNCKTKRGDNDAKRTRTKLTGIGSSGRAIHGASAAGVLQRLLLPDAMQHAPAASRQFPEKRAGVEPGRFCFTSRVAAMMIVATCARPAAVS